MKPLEEDDPRLSFLSFSKAATRQGPCYAVHNSYWCVCPKRGLILYGPNKAPQCNQNRDISIDLRDRLYPWASVVRVDLVLLEDGGR